MLTLVQEGVQQLHDRVVLGHRDDVAAEPRQGRILVAIDHPRQQLVLQHVPDHVIVATVLVQRDARESQAAMAADVIADGLVGGGHLDHGSRRHDILGLHAAEAQQVADDLRFLLLEHTVLRTDVRHRQEVAAGERTVDLLFFQRPGNELAEPDQRREQADDQCQRAGRERRQFAPVVGAERLRNQFRQHQDRQRHDHRHHQPGHQRVGIRPDLCRLVADTDRTGRMRNRIQRQDRGQRPIDVFLERLQATAQCTALPYLDLGI